MASLTFTVYSRSDCHLCEEMLVELRRLCDGREAAIEVIDIDRDASLSRRYGLAIPVLAIAGQELCRYRIDAEKVKERLMAL